MDLWRIAVAVWALRLDWLLWYQGIAVRVTARGANVEQTGMCTVFHAILGQLTDRLRCETKRGLGHGSFFADWSAWMVQGIGEL